MERERGGRDSAGQDLASSGADLDGGEAQLDLRARAMLRRRVQRKASEGAGAAEKDDTADAAAETKEEAYADVDALDLTAATRQRAYTLKKAHPTITFNSGRRDRAEQAQAMASHVVGDRQWISKTYAASTGSQKCQKWVDDHADAKTAEAIAAGLLTVLNGLTDPQLANLSRHSAGMAFDVQPVEDDTGKVKSDIQALAGLKKFLDKEGEDVVWHAEFID